MLSRAKFPLLLWGSHTHTEPILAPHPFNGLNTKMAAASSPLMSAPPVASLPESTDSFPPLDFTASPESPLKHFLPRPAAAQSAQKQFLPLPRDLSPVIAPYDVSASAYDMTRKGRYLQWHLCKETKQSGKTLHRS